MGATTMTKKECIEKMHIANETLQNTEGFNDRAIAVCQDYKPGPFTETPKF